jgi:hypothetical protein
MDTGGITDSRIRNLQCGNWQHVLHIARPGAGNFCFRRSLETNVETRWHLSMKVAFKYEERVR